MPLEANYPADCALAFAIPLSRERFLTALDQSENDFVSHFRKGRGLQRADPEFCWQVYEAEEAAFVSAVCEDVAQRGVTVVHDVELTQLTALLAQFSVVTLVAHFRFVEFEIEDIEGPLAILDSLREPASELQRKIRERVIDLDPDLLEHGRDRVESLQSRLSNVFRTIAHQAERLYWDENVQTSSGGDAHFDMRLTRAEFERAFPGDIKPASVIEFSDGLHTIPELVQSIPVEFSGLLDLTVCNSVIPASIIREHRPNCLIAANRKPAELRSRMYLYGLEISLLAKEPALFVDVITKVHSRRSSYDTKGATLWKLLGRFYSAMRARQ